MVKVFVYLDRKCKKHQSKVLTCYQNNSVTSAGQQIQNLTSVLSARRFVEQKVVSVIILKVTLLKREHFSALIVKKTTYLWTKKDMWELQMTKLDQRKLVSKKHPVCLENLFLVLYYPITRMRIKKRQILKRWQTSKGTNLVNIMLNKLKFKKNGKGQVPVVFLLFFNRLNLEIFSILPQKLK